MKTNVRELDMPTLKRLSLNALLYSKPKTSNAVANELSRRLHIQLGERCPSCNSKNVRANAEQGECKDCEEHWYLDNEEIYHD